MRFHQLMQRADRVVQRTLRSLPPELREPAASLPVVYERAPTPEIVADGVEPDTLGLFVGPSHMEDPGSDLLPSQILIFLDNIWDFTAGDPAAFDDEIRVTYLHELGHYLGLDEGDLEKRGLE
jgi:predicted Zn-dependent protease with MMP-like domain